MQRVTRVLVICVVETINYTEYLCCCFPALRRKLNTVFHLHVHFPRGGKSGTDGERAAHKLTATLTIVNETATGENARNTHEYSYCKLIEAEGGCNVRVVRRVPTLKPALSTGAIRQKNI